MTQGAVDPNQWLADYTARVGEIGRKAQETQEQIAAARGRAEGAAGAVVVEVGPGGRLEELRLDQRAMQMRPEELARVITETTRQAHHATVAQVQGALHGLVGDSDAMDFVRDISGAAVQADDLAHGVAAPEERSRPAPRDHDEDDDFGGPVLR